MLGEVEKERLVRTNGARPGDAIILTKGIAIEGTAVIAREHLDEMVPILGAQTLTRCRNFMYNPGLSVIKEALLASEHASVHAMHDPTEGGLATALHEVAWAAKVGLRIHADSVPVFPETQAICNHYHLNPMGLIASGALLIIVQANEAEKVLTRIRSQGIAATVIGEVTDKRKGVKLLTADGVVDLPLYEQDELTKI
jgi:hydrogenase maturation factor